MASIQGEHKASQEPGGAKALIWRLLLARDRASTGYDTSLRVGELVD